ncbi:hypothetical protein AA0X95_04310 [Bacillus sp. 1P10SD]|uniref:hypothetical protein n=1 Tax=Bacillus sp. 1P10SD TaxID=3132265 RepID=UPI0039A5413A
MVKYLQMDGVDDYLRVKTSAVLTGKTYNNVQLDIELLDTSTAAKAIYGDSNSLLAFNANTTFTVQKLTITSGAIFGQRTTINFTLNASTDLIYGYFVRVTFFGRIILLNARFMTSNYTTAQP